MIIHNYDSCVNCLHKNVCAYFTIGVPVESRECDDYSDKSEWVHVPCKLWETVWAIWHDQVIETEIMSIKYIINSKICGFWIDTVVDSFSGYLDKHVFLTKEEAEKHLRKGVNDDL